MRKCLLFLVCAVLLTFTSCGRSDTDNYFPDYWDIIDNLEEKGYKVNHHRPELVYNDKSCPYTGEYIDGIKNESYMFMYHIDQPEGVEYFTTGLNPGDYDRYIVIRDDDEFGTIVCCGTSQAIEDAGIRYR